MTVKELIAKLSEFPQDMQVVTQMYSDYQPFDEEFIERKQLAIRQGRYMSYYPQWYPKDETPVLVDVVYFQGN